MVFAETEPPDSSQDLRALPIFASLSDAECEAVFFAMKPRKIAREVHINLARDFVGLVGVVWSGTFITQVSLPPRRAVTLSRLKPGSAFSHMPQGYSGFFGRGHLLRSLAEGVILEMEGEEFSRFLDAIPVLARAMMKQISLSAAEYAARVYELCALSAQERIQAELLRRARDGEWIGRTSRINPRPTHQELADQVGVAREVATRRLSVLAEQGVIGIEPDALVVIDVEGLLALDFASTGRRLFDTRDYIRTPDSRSDT